MPERSPRLATKPEPRSRGRRSVASLLRLTHRLYSRALLAAVQERGVTTLVQWWILRTLWAEDGLTQRELSARLDLYESALVPVLNTLCANRLIVRARNRDDRRKVNVFLTKEGRALERELLPLADKVNRVASSGVDPAALAVVWNTLTAIHGNLEAHIAARSAKPPIKAKAAVATARR